MKKRIKEKKREQLPKQFLFLVKIQTCLALCEISMKELRRSSKWLKAANTDASKYASEIYDQLIIDLSLDTLPINRSRKQLF